MVHQFFTWVSRRRSTRFCECGKNGSFRRVLVSRKWDLCLIASKYGSWSVPDLYIKCSVIPKYESALLMPICVRSSFYRISFASLHVETNVEFLANMALGRCQAYLYIECLVEFGLVETFFVILRRTDFSETEVQLTAFDYGSPGSPIPGLFFKRFLSFGGELFRFELAKQYHPESFSISGIGIDVGKKGRC